MIPRIYSNLKENTKSLKSILKECLPLEGRSDWDALWRFGGQGAGMYSVLTGCWLQEFFSVFEN